MRLRRRWVFVLVLGMVIGGALPAAAHKVNLFCYLENGVLYGEGYYRGGEPAERCRVEIYQKGQKDALVRAETDDKGKFAMALNVRGPLQVVLDAGQGHRAEFLLDGADKGNVVPIAGSGPGILSILAGLLTIVGISGLWYGVRKKYAS